MVPDSGGIGVAKTMNDGTLRPDPEALLAHSGWVRALARSLVADPAGAEDVEQEAWRRALESPPRHAGNLRAWLASVVRSVAAQRGRTEGRAAARHERLNQAADRSTGSGPRQAPPRTPGEIAERMETFQALAQSIGQLKEPYASAIYLRFVEELSVAQVAARQAVPVPTAATRIRRGLELLRGHMQGRFGDTWKARCLVFVPPATSAAIPPVIAGAIAMTSKTKLLLGAAVIALAIPIYSVLQPEGDLDDGTGERSAVEASLPTASDSGGPLVEVEQVGPTRTELAPLAPEAGTEVDPRALRVVVRDAETLEVVPGAEILYFDRASEKDEDWNRDQSRFEGKEILLDRYGDRYTADEQGRAVLPARKSYAHIAARIEGAFASTYLFDDVASDGGTEVELLLRPTKTITIEVVDSLGRPVPNQRVEYQNAFGTSFAQCLTPTVTNDEGVAQLRNIQERLAEGNPSNIHRIAVPIPGGVVAREFLLHEPPSEVVRLQLPATGSLRVLLRDPEGNPIRDGRPVQMQAFAEREHGSDLPKANAQFGTQMVWTKGGEAYFKRVALNTKLVAWIQSPGQRDPLEVVGFGPMVEGQVAELTLGTPAAPTVVSLLVVDEEGRAFADRGLSMQQVVLQDGQAPDPIHTRVGTQADGRTRFYQDASVDEGTTASESARIQCIASNVGEGWARWGVHTWPLATAPGDNEIGTLVMGRELVNAGVVFGSDGKPVAFAELDVRIPAPWAGGEEHQNWVQFKADENGRYELRGEGLESSSTLDAYVSEPSLDRGQSMGQLKLELIVGAVEQELRLGSLAMVAGRLLLPKGLPLQQLQMSARVTDAQGEESFHFLDFEAGNGRYTCGRLPVGTGQLVITASAGLVVARSELFSTASGGDCTPEAWLELDLRDRLFVHRVNLRGSDGSTPERVSVMFDDFDRGVICSNPAVLVSDQDRLHITVNARGYRPSTSTLISGEAELVLAVGVPVRFVLPDGVSLPEGKWTVFLRKLQEPGLPGGADRKIAQLEAGQAAWEADLPFSGKYMLGFVRELESGEPYPTQPPIPVLWPGETPFINIEIEDSFDRQQIVLELSQAALDAAGSG
jgi:RNA polymerase sigma-70 factor, ECF subfamily